MTGASCMARAIASQRPFGKTLGAIDRPGRERPVTGGLVISDEVTEQR
jgi:hypothetical protein